MNEVFKLIFDRVSAIVTGNVYDHVYEDLNESNYPFVRVDAIQTNGNDTDTENGFVATIQIVGYSNYRGVKEINDIADEVYTALHKYNFPDTANYGISGIHENFRTIVADGLTRNSVQRYTITFEPLPI